MTISDFAPILQRLAAESGERFANNGSVYADVRELAAAGFGKLRVPTEYGGYGVDQPTLFEYLAEAGRADSNVPQILRAHFTTVETLRALLPDPAAMYWLRKIGEGAIFGQGSTEPATNNTGDFRITARIHSEDGVPVVSGVKFYSTGSLYADYIRVSAYDEQDELTAAVVSATHPGVKHEDDWDGIGQRLTGSGTTRFDAVPIEADGTWPRSRRAGAATQAFTQLVHLANLAGIARSIVDDAKTLVRTRARTHLHSLSAEPVRDPEVLGVLGNLYRRSQLADALLLRASTALEVADHAAAAAGSDEDVIAAYAGSFIEISAAQVSIIENVLAAATELFNAGGASAVQAKNHLDRHWNNARVLSSHNPVVHKPRLVGDYILNGVPPRELLDVTWIQDARDAANA